MDPKPQEIPIDPGAYIETLEGQIRDLSIELLRLRAIVTQMFEAALKMENEFQTDESGEILELEDGDQ